MTCELNNHQFTHNAWSRTGCYVSRCKLAFIKIRGDVVKHKLQIQDDKVDFNKVLITG
jgi:hypothetical protein